MLQIHTYAFNTDLDLMGTEGDIIVALLALKSGNPILWEFLLSMHSFLLLRCLYKKISYGHVWWRTGSCILTRHNTGLFSEVIIS